MMAAAANAPAGGNEPFRLAAALKCPAWRREPFTFQFLRQAVQEQQIAKLSTQIEESYSQVQDIAVKAIEGSAGAKNVLPVQPALTEAPRTTAKADD